MEFVWFILIGLAAGWLAGQLMKGGGFGIVGDIVVGVIGALLGGFLFRTLGVSAGGGLLGSLIVATIGAVILLFLLRLIKRAYVVAEVTAGSRTCTHGLGIQELLQ